VSEANWDDKCLSTRDCGEETILTIDMMCMKTFFRIDMFVQKLLVDQKDDSDSEMDESEKEDACYYM
jgi:hypothetical protein